MIDRTDPAGAIAEAAERCSNWGRWGEDDVRGTMNFLTEAKRVEAAALIRRGRSFSLSQRFDMDGPQKGWRRRTNPVHTMLDTGTDARSNAGTCINQGESRVSRRLEVVSLILEDDLRS